MGQQLQPSARVEARRFGADAMDGYRARRAGRGCIALEVLAVVATAAVLTHFGTDLSTPTIIGLAIIALIAGNIVFALPFVGILASVAVSLFWGKLAFALLNECEGPAHQPAPRVLPAPVSEQGARPEEAWGAIGCTALPAGSG